jgi:tartrate dehydratase beta subunit/fumarate hydratase class I family protein
LPAAPEQLDFANFHCSPAATVNPDGRATVGAVTATASFRFAKWLDGFFRLSRCNIIIGKAGMKSEIYKRHFVPNNAIYLTTVGYGTGALLGREIKRVAAIYWVEELGLAQAIWVLDVNDFRPFLVESDLAGNSPFERENARDGLWALRGTHMTARYLIMRLIIPTLFGITLITFVLIQFAPGGPVEHILARMHEQGLGRDIGLQPKNDAK